MSWRHAILVNLLMLMATTLLIILLAARETGKRIAHLEAERSLFNTRHGTIEYLVWGEGPHVLVVHGAGGGFDQGRLLAESLGGEGLTFISVSRFGYLGSDLSEVPSTRAQAEALVDLLDHLGVDQAHVLAMSGGVPPALKLAELFPNRTGRMALLSSAPFTPFTPEVEGRPVPTWVYSALLGNDTVYWALTKNARRQLEEAFDARADLIGNLPSEEQTFVRSLVEGFLPASRRLSGVNNEGSAGHSPVAPNTANRHIGNIRSLYGDYFKHVGEEERPNPFRNMHFKAKARTEVPPYSSEWVRTKVLAPGATRKWRPELQLITLMLIETGCRPSEIINLRVEDFHIDEPVPYISIRARTDREVKTDTSERDIPLVGISLEAARRAAPRAFAHYYDKGELFSANMMKNFRNRGLLESPDHKIYSFRHAFEKRMQEANIDYGLRCLLMGHKTTRPVYGDGGSLAYRRAELLKIVHPFDARVMDLFERENLGWALGAGRAPC